ncbi:LOW QUALITY PROTEIN: ankyrin repeat domain-containing protein 40 [Esox lucius]|uniref:LOW QUALITY PROTEIN: ankyrin repeat domain-containing protein 40 n=1 Tax=Esox lucius TaxID=8010 RepID=UPI001476DFB0|nr:LOW QUALITY PROTEIN: ankyrin repeat domain-containing protein 40 [Esox lucius]
MSTTSLDKELQERLREASAIGDIDEVRLLVESGVNVNSQNEINGWTCLHWACKRNHKAVVSYLLSSGADQEILTPKMSWLSIEEEDVPEIKEPELPIIPNYLSNPPFMYSKMDNKAELILAQLTQNGNGDHSDDPHSDPASLSPSHEKQQTQQPQSLLSDTPSPREGLSFRLRAERCVAKPRLVHTVKWWPSHGPVHGAPSGQPRGLHPLGGRSGPVCSPPLASPSPSNGSSGSQAQVANANPSMTRQQSVPQQLNCGQGAGGNVAAFQPFFFTSTFPVNVQELVLKVRIQNPNARENDFIEVELDRQELTYRSLLRVCCRELDISAEHVEKIRKLPNTMLRKDKDVARLQDFQELELVLEKAEGLSLLSGAGGLTDRPCYNMKASRLTY